MSTDQSERSVRLAKLEAIKSLGHHPYPEKYDKQHSLRSCSEKIEGVVVKTAGRLMLIRDMGKIIFAHLKDQSGRMQIAFKEDVVGKERLQFVLKHLDLGDFIGVEGEIFVTKTGEKTILVKDFTFLGKNLRPLPEKFHGLQDKEAKYRQRYLDTMMDDTTRDRFIFRSNFIKALRDFYEQNGFLEVETSILGNSASGALAKPFETHHNALDLDVFLRIALETPQKELIVGGFEKTFEIGKVFRNEGMDPSHLQEFTMLEHYAAYWNYEDNMRFTEEMFVYLSQKLLGTLKIPIPNRDGQMVEVDFTPPWPRVTMRELLLRDCGIDIDLVTTTADLRAQIVQKKIEIEELNKLEYGNLVDALYKKVSRPKIIGPVFLTGHPIELSPLARKNDENPKRVDRFQLVVVGWEIVNAYSELVDPIDQKQRFEDQSSAKDKGDEDAHGKDDDYIKAMEYGMPPISGWGMGVDRIVALLTAQSNLRDVVLFPLMRPEESEPHFDTPPPLTSPLKGEESAPHSAERGSSVPSQEVKIEIGCTREDALKLIQEVAGSEMTSKHLLSVGAAMKHLCTVYGDEQNIDAWEIAGLLHDIDWDITNQDPAKHCGEETATLLRDHGLSEEMILIIRSHYEETGIPRDRLIQKALFAVDELCGLIIAAAIMRPSKSLDDLEVKSVLKKFKDKSFAAKIRRDWIQTCETELQTPLDTFIAYTIEGLKPAGKEIGLQ